MSAQGMQMVRVFWVGFFGAQAGERHFGCAAQRFAQSAAQINMPHGSCQFGAIHEGTMFVAMNQVVDQIH